MNIRLLALVPLLPVVHACGITDTSGSQGLAPTSTATATQTSTETIDPTKNGQNGAASDSATFQGFINSAFELTVDGEKYNDMEDFYTKELARLPSKVNAAGYDNSWKVSFDAQIGLNDLWQEMKVYISPVVNRGFQGEGTVGAAGAFAITLPPAALDTEYRVRAVKRIAVVLQKQNETVRVCYNFSASEKSILFSEREKPIILDTFVSSITAYDCQLAESGIRVPSVLPDESHPTVKLANGASKDDVLVVLGLKNLFVSAPTRWCWGKADAKADVCANISYDQCQCYVEFNEDGKVSLQSNIRGDLLDLATW